MIGIYKTIISLIIWPIWFTFFVPSLFLLYALVFIIPPKYFYLIVRPVCWIYCLLAGQVLIIKNKPPPLQGQPYLYLFNHLSMFDQFMVPTKSISTDQLVVRLMTWDHIPEHPGRKTNPKTPADYRSKVNFPPFKHFVKEEGEWKEVVRSHW